MEPIRTCANCGKVIRGDKYNFVADNDRSLVYTCNTPKQKCLEIHARKNAHLYDYLDLQNYLKSVRGY